MWYNEIMSKNRNKGKNYNNQQQNEMVVVDEKLNSLTELALGFCTGTGAQISQGDTIDVNLRRYMLTLNRALLSQLYCEIGIAQTLVGQPVDDAFKDFPEIRSEQLDENNIEDIKKFFEQNKWFEIFKQGIKWARLFGGAGLFLNVPQNPKSELRLDRLKKGDKVSLYAVDRWELNYQVDGSVSVENLDGTDPLTDTPYCLYGQWVHKSRVMRMCGRQAPSLLRLQLGGWGMSEIERLIRSLNSFLKNQDVVFELLDEAKIDVYKVNGYNASLLTKGGTEKIRKQVQMSNQLKSYLDALLMDKEDEYDQKTMAFSGLSELLVQNRQSLAADLKMPVTKLFGISASGFNSGEDDIENYNSMLESEIRAQNKGYFITLVEIACAVLFGFIPDDIDVTFGELRELSAEQVENVKDRQFARLLQTYQAQIIDEEQFVEGCNRGKLLPIDIKNAQPQNIAMFNRPQMNGNNNERTNSKSKKWWKW